MHVNAVSAVAVTLAKVANDVKAADIRVLFVKPLVYWTRFFIIVTAFSRPQIDAIGYLVSPEIFAALYICSSKNTSESVYP